MWVYALHVHKLFPFLLFKCVEKCSGQGNTTKTTKYYYNPSIFIHLSNSGSWGSWGLSQVSWEKRQCTPWTGCQPVNPETQTSIHTHIHIMGNLKSPVDGSMYTANGGVSLVAVLMFSAVIRLSVFVPNDHSPTLFALHLSWPCTSHCEKPNERILSNFMSLDCREEAGVPGEKSNKLAKSTEKSHSQMVNSNSGPSCCEPTVLTTIMVPKSTIHNI